MTEPTDREAEQLALHKFIPVELASGKWTWYCGCSEISPTPTGTTYARNEEAHRRHACKSAREELGYLGDVRAQRLEIASEHELVQVVPFVLQRRTWACSCGSTGRSPGRWPSSVERIRASHRRHVLQHVDKEMSRRETALR